RPGGGAGGGSRPLSRGAGDRHARPGTAGPLPRDGTGTHGRTRMLIKMTQGAPYGVATGADGALWFTLTEPGAIGRLVPGEEPVVHRLDPADGGPTVIAPGPDGAMWFTEFRGNRVGRITPDSEVTSYEAESPYGIVAGPDGAMRYASMRSDRIGRIAAHGRRAEITLRVVGGMPAGVASCEAESPWGIVGGPDGAMWYASMRSDRIGRIAADGRRAEFTLTVVGGMPSGIAAGDDGALWFTLNQAGTVGRITVDGETTLHPLPTEGAAPVHITAGPDGALWFAEIGAGQIGRVTPEGKITE